MDEKTAALQFDELLSTMSSMPDLSTLVDDLTTEERDLLNQVDFFAEPTDQDLADFGPEFVEHLLDTTLRRYQRSRRQPILTPARWVRPAEPTLATGLELLRLLSEVDERAAMKGAASSDLTAKSVKLAGDLADLFSEELDRTLAQVK